jgi:uncharacterized iron-regulated membrane protein
MLNFILFCCLVLLVVALCFWFRARNHGLWRRILYKTHLWLGIISGIVLFIVCLTGTVLVFEGDIERFFEHKLVVSHPDMSLLDLEDLLTKVEQNAGGKAILVSLPDRRGDAVRFYIKITETENNKNTETKDEVRFEAYQIDPYTGEILDDIYEKYENASTSHYFFERVSDLHTSLFLPSSIGKIVVGSATLIFVVIVLSGLCLWLPANFRNKKAWTNGLLVRFRKGKHSLLFDLHKTLGFYALIPVLLMALTGLMWSFQWYNKGVQMIFNAPNTHSLTFEKVKSLPPNPDAKRLPLDYFDKKADEMFASHKGVNRGIYFEDDGTIMVMGGHQQGTWLSKLGYDKIYFNKYTGEVLQFDQFDKFPLGKKLVMRFPYFHYGSFLGLPTKIIFFLACLIATTLPVTGVIIWWRKLRNLRKTKKE